PVASGIVISRFEFRAAKTPHEGNYWSRLLWRWRDTASSCDSSHIECRQSTGPTHPTSDCASSGNRRSLSDLTAAGIGSTVVVVRLSVTRHDEDTSIAISDGHKCDIASDGESGQFNTVGHSLKLQLVRKSPGRSISHLR